jgi:hypothetical protein
LSLGGRKDSAPFELSDELSSTALPAEDRFAVHNPLSHFCGCRWNVRQGNDHKLFLVGEVLTTDQMINLVFEFGIHSLLEFSG